ncbi:MAG: hypothetical protein RLZZ330_729 [Actinomycetota bacterium]
MSDLLETVVSRSLKLATLPLGIAGRATTSIGKRIFSSNPELITAELQAKTAEQIFQTLGELKGGAMKMGQALSIFESMLPEEFAEPYRNSLTRLQDSAPPMPTSTVESVLVKNLGKDWQKQFQHFDYSPSAAASIGQVHKAIWHDGRTVAVKIQYPGAGKALAADIKQASRIARLVAIIAPGVEIEPLLEEIQDRMLEEIDYKKEAKVQRAFAIAFENDPEFKIPKVILSTESMLISEWLDGKPLSRIIESGNQDERNRVGLLYERFLLSSPSRCGYLHADPHPGNFRVTEDGKLGVLDFGATAHLPEGLPTTMGRLMAISMSNDPNSVVQGLRDEGFLLPDVDIDAQQLHDYLAPFTEPAQNREFEFTREWMRETFSRVSDPRNPDFTIGLKLNLPPSYLMIHRVWLGSIGVLSQLECTIPAQGEVAKWVPGFATN